MEPNAPTPSHGPANPQQGDEFDLRHYLQIVWSRAWLVVACVLLAFVLGTFDLKRTREEYVARASLRYEKSEPQVFNFDPQQQTQGASEELRTLIELVRSPAVAEMVLQSLNLEGEQWLDDPGETKSGAFTEKLMELVGDLRLWFRTNVLEMAPPDLSPEVFGRQFQIQALLQGLEVEIRPKTAIVEVRYRSSDKYKAKRLADAFCRQFIAFLNESKLAATEEARVNAERNIEDIRGKLTESEQRLLDYRVADVSQLQLRRQLTEERIRELNKVIATRSNDLISARGEAEGLRRANEQGVFLSKDSFLNDFRKRFNDLQIRRATLVAEARPNHPELLQVERELVFIDDQITSAVLALQTESGIRLQMLEETLANQREVLREAEQELDFISRSLVEHGTLSRDVETYRRLYDEMLSGYKEMAVASTMEQAPVQIVHLADIPAFPDSPKVTRVLAVWVILGAGFGMGLILLFEHLDRTIKSPRTVEETLGLPTLGTIPYLEPAPGRMFQKQRGRAIRLITTLGAKSAEVEAFRYLRTALQYSSAGARPRVIQLTSCTPREGKSTATMNLAIAVAQRGERTLLIDADLKKPVVHQTFGVPRRPGLTDVLTGNRPFAECVQSAEGVEHLDVIPAGPAVPNPADLLDSAAMEELIAKALETYAVVLIDSPPLMGMADAFVLARKVDGVCLVTRAGVTRRDVLAKMVQSLDAMNARLLGVVYNVPKRGRKPSDYYGYYNTMEQDAEDDAPPPSGTATART